MLTKIEDADGEVLFQSKVRPRVRIVDEGPAYQVHNALSQDLQVGVAAGRDHTAQTAADGSRWETGHFVQFQPTHCLPVTTAT